MRSGVGLRLNIYLYEIAENRNFRRASWDDVRLPSGAIAASQPPTYVDCHYLISSWSQMEDSELASPVLDEHQSLAEALRILLRNPGCASGCAWSDRRWPGIPGSACLSDRCAIRAAARPQRFLEHDEAALAPCDHACGHRSAGRSA